MATAKSVAEVRDRFTEQLQAVVDTGKNLVAAARLEEPAEQHKIDKNEWSGDVFDIEEIHSAFDRHENEDDVIQAIRDPKSPGTVGDLMASSIQGDYLATMERAFRSRHQTRIRAVAHAAARRRGHGHDAGVFKRGMLGYVTDLVKMAKGKQQ